MNKLSDLFHPDIPTDFLLHAFEVAMACPQRAFHFLTKHPERIEPVLYGPEGNFYLGGGDWPPNVWIGCVAEDQATFNARWRVFQARSGEQISWAYALQLFLSLDPLRGAVDLRPALSGVPRVSWVVAGAECDPQGLVCNAEWVREIIAQCRAWRVPVLVKRYWGTGPIGGSLESDEASDGAPRPARPVPPIIRSDHDKGGIHA